MSKTPANSDLDPLFEFAFRATGFLPTHKQQLFALYYLRALQGQRRGKVRPLSELVPANLYRGVRHFLADTDWDHREVIWAAAAQALEHFEIEWLASNVTATKRWTFAWLAAFDSGEVLPLDLVLIGPTDSVGAKELVPAQRDILRRASDALLRAAPVGLAGNLAEDAATRRRLAERKVTYSAKVRPSSPLIGRIRFERQLLSVRAFASLLRDRGQQSASAPSGLRWGASDVRLVPPTGAQLDETAVFAWDGDRLAEAYLTNASPARTRRIYGPAEEPLIVRDRGRIRWEPTSLRGARAWEHHLALLSVLQAFRVAQG
jgi:hypothetical protein